MRKMALVLLIMVPWGAVAQGISLGLWFDALNITQAKAALLSWDEGLGLPQEALEEVSAIMGELPNLVPVPLFGISLGIPVGSVELQLAGALLTDGLLRKAGLWPAQGIDLAESLHLDLTLQAYRLALGVAPRLDLGIVAFALAAGLSLSGGDLSLQVATDEEKLRWGGIGGTLGARLELGLPFLRLFSSGAIFFPWGQIDDVWDVRVGPWQGTVGVVIRF